MRKEKTIYANYELVVDEFGIPVAVVKDGVPLFRLYEHVIVSPDCYGYITPGITKPGGGRIVEIQRDTTDHWFGVLLYDNQFGYVKEARLTKIK